MRNALNGIVSDQDFYQIMMVVRDSRLPLSMRDDAIQEIGAALIAKDQKPESITLLARGIVNNMTVENERWNERAKRGGSRTADGLRYKTEEELKEDYGPTDDNPQNRSQSADDDEGDRLSKGCRLYYANRVKFHEYNESDEKLDEEETAKKLVVEDSETYHANAGRFLSSHLLASFRKCPQLYRRKVEGLIKDNDTASYLVGRATHTLILEGRETFDSQYAVGGPVNPSAGKTYGSDSKKFQEWAAEIGKQVLSDQDMEQIEAMAAAVESHNYAAELLRDGHAERVVRTKYCGTDCQIRMDWFSFRQAVGLVDLKTCKDLTYFEADSKNFSYMHQLAFYRSVLGRVLGKVVPVHLIAVEKFEPFRCGVWEVPRDLLEQCELENEAAIRRLLRCAETGVWPTGYETPRVMTAA